MEGYLNKIGKKQGQGRNGPYTLFSAEIGGDWYGCGFNAPNAKEGDYVTFDVVQKGQYKNAENIVVASNSNSGGGNGAKASAPPPVNKKDVSIHFQSCRKDAIQTVALLLSGDDKAAVKLPAKQAEKYDAVLALIDELTTRYYLRLDEVIEEGGVSVEDLVPMENA